jgi:oligopeptide/dipeptide ABC transporter ATP-binding protein
MSILLITHHLGIVAEFADRVAVMYAGQVVEQGRAENLLARPRHPYTRALLKAVPQLGGEGGRLDGIPGQVPAAGAWPSGCRFHPRCREAREDCPRLAPALTEVAPGEAVRCPWWQAGTGAMSSA